MFFKITSKKYIIEKWDHHHGKYQFNNIMEFANQGLRWESTIQGKIDLLEYMLTVIREDLKYSLIAEVMYKKQAVDFHHKLIPNYIDSTGDYIEILRNMEKKEVQISLTDDCVIGVPWACMSIWEKAASMLKEPFIRDNNHRAVYFPELKICFVLSGNHSIAVGVIYKKGIILAKTCSILPAFDHLKSDGFNWFDVHTNKILEPVKDSRIAALFEIAKMKYNIESSRKDIEMKKTTIDAIRDSVITYGIEYDLAKIVLFGSYARHDETENSDIDLMIDAEDSNLTLFDLSGMREDLRLKLGKKVDIITAAGLDQKVKENVLEDQIILYEREK